MGGDLQVESVVGEGSTFTLSIPYKPTAAPEVIQPEDGLEHLSSNYDAEDEIPLVADPGAHMSRVLAVEDDLDMQTYIKKLLFPAYDVTLAVNGKQALEKLKNTPVDLIVSDAMMPEMDGFTLLERLKESEDLQNIPVIMLTALNFEDSRLRALSIGVDDYLTKPFSPQELLARTKNLLLRYQIRKEWLKEEEHQQSTASLEEAHENAPVIIYKSDQEWLKCVEQYIKKELENSQFQIADLAERFSLSRRQFQRKINKLTGLSPKQYQQEIALQKAREILEAGAMANVTAVGYSVGMNNASRFSRLYNKRFGKKPVDYFRLEVFGE